MRHDSHYLLTGPGPGPLARLLGALAAAAALTVSLILGFVFFLVLLGVGLVVGIVVWLQVRRLRREIAAQVDRSSGPGRAAPDKDVLEGDYEVVRESERPGR